MSHSRVQRHFGDFGELADFNLVAMRVLTCRLWAGNHEPNVQKERALIQC